MSDLRKTEKTAAHEAKRETSDLKHAEKALSHAEKYEHKGQKAEDKAIKQKEKAIKYEHKTAVKLAEAQASHDKALADLSKIDKDVALKHDAHLRAEQDIQARKQALDSVEARHHAGEVQRQSRIAQAKDALSPSRDTGVSPPAGATPGGVPAQGQGASYPAQGQGASYPAQGQGASYPAQGQGASYPAQGQGASYPAQG